MVAILSVFLNADRQQKLIDSPAWATKPIKQDVVYEDRQAVERALAKLQKLPPLVTPTEVR